MRAFFAKRIADLNQEYHEFVLSEFLSALPKLNLACIEGHGNVPLSGSEHAKLTEVIEKAKYAFVLPFAEFLKEKELHVNSQDVDSRLSVELILSLCASNGQKIVRNEVTSTSHLAPPYDQHAVVDVRAFGEASNVTFVAPERWGSQNNLNKR